MKIDAHAKVNIFLKIVGTRENYHLLVSRFMRLENLYDTIRFEPDATPRPDTAKAFRLEGDFGCAMEKNTIYKAYRSLLEVTDSKKLRDFFEVHAVVVEKKIPEFAGLGGGSSDAAAFMRLANEVCGLKLTTEELARIGSRIGADVPFFIFDYPSANVSGIGEVVTPFEEEPILVETFTPDIRCDTAAVYRAFRETAMGDLAKNRELAQKLERLPSGEILQRYDPAALNDLFTPACRDYPELAVHAAPGWFFSGSGSTFFTPQIRGIDG